MIYNHHQDHAEGTPRERQQDRHKQARLHRKGTERCAQADLGTPQNVVQLLQCYLRAAELEMRAAEEPLKANLDAAGLEAQVLERIDPGGVRAGAGGAAGGAGTRNGGARV